MMIYTKEEERIMKRKKIKKRIVIYILVR